MAKNKEINDGAAKESNRVIMTAVAMVLSQ